MKSAQNRARLAVLIPAVLILQLFTVIPAAVATDPSTVPVTADATVSSEAPTGLKVAGRDAFGLKLAWNVWNNAPRYRVQLSTSPDMANASFYRFPPTTGEIRGLQPDTVYYARVAALSEDGNTRLSPYSAQISGRTDSADPGATPTPSGLKSTAQSPVSINLAWNSWNNAELYRIQFSTKADLSDSGFIRYSTTSAEIRGLNANTSYYFRVVALSPDGNERLSDYSPVISAKTKTATTPLAPVTSPLSVASFNIKCANCFSGVPNELPWTDRRSAVVSTITSQMPDVIGIQEASQGWLSNEPRPGGLSQFEDLRDRLNGAGAPYRLTNDKRNNCVNHVTPTNCVYEDQGASQGTKLYFNPSTVDLLKQGSHLVPSANGADNARYLAWGIFKQKSTGKRFFVGNTHLQPGGGDAYHALRKQQTESVLAEIKSENVDKLPVIITGDFNSHKWTEPANVTYDVITGAGYVDPLGNTYKTDLPSGNATVENRIGTFYDSFNGFDRQAKARNNYGNGTYLDYIFTSKMRVSEWETVVKVDSNGRFIGTIPSDHNMVRADVDLPMVAETIPAPTPAPTTIQTFTDVPRNNQFFTEISWLATERISTGWTEQNATKTFRPLQSVNRDAMAAFMYRASGSPTYTPPKTSPFADVSTNNLYYKEISWLASTGISTGWVQRNGTKTFRPLQSVGRNAMAAFMYRLADSPSFKAPTSTPFDDISTQEQFYKEMAWLASTGISTGWTESNDTKTFRALQPVNRDAMAAFLFRFSAKFQ
ncbi:fibronectin type III domain-containing protein [Arthrobacter sp. CAN_A1]|uniref:fibronectin type III domain-containing protein n=1 Tax=Arthrobacter sp. CAN_A1 TaxID=2787717 RepID=UPI0018CA3E78